MIRVQEFIESFISMFTGIAIIDYCLPVGNF